MNAVPVAYIRKSTKGGQDSRADQVAGARELAARHGDAADLLVLDGDWAISASREKTTKRLDFLRLMAMVEAGEVSALYATDADRLARSVQWAARLGDLCEDRGVLIHTPVKTFDLSDDSDRLLFQFAAMTNEAEVKKLQRKAAARVTRQRERGSRMGQAPYGERDGEDLQAVLDAFAETGSYQGTARLLIERGVTSRRGHLFTPDGIPMSWSASTVRAIVTREAPEKVPARPTKGSRTIAIRRFTRLLICPHDGSYLTSQVVNGGATGYLCRVGHRSPDGEHPRPYAIREHVVLGWVKDAVKYMVNRHETAILDDGIEADITSLQARKERLGQAYVDGVISEPAYKAQLASIEAEKDRLANATRASVTWRKGISWDLPEGEVNSRLRDLITGIRLGYVEDGVIRGRHSNMTRSLVPVGAIWRRQPTIEVGDEWASVVPHPMAEAVDGGWFMPDAVVVKPARRVKAAVS